MAKLDFNSKVVGVLKKKMFAVSNGDNFQIFHYPFKNDKEFDSVRELGVEKKTSLFLPVSHAQKTVNLWLFSGLSDVDVSKKRALKISPVKIGIPKNKMRTKWQDSFIMQKAEVFNFCMKAASGDGMIVKVDRPYSLDYVVKAMAKDMFEQYCERSYHDNKERKIENLMQNRFIKFLSNVDAVEIVRTNEARPLFVSDDGAEILQTKSGIPVAMPNEEGVVNYFPELESYWEGFKVVMYSFKDKETKAAVGRMVELIKRTTGTNEENEDEADLELTK